MRHTTKGVIIHTLEEKKELRKLVENPEKAKQMIDNHERSMKNVKTKTVSVENDPFHTRFTIHINKDENEVIRKYKESRKY